MGGGAPQTTAPSARKYRLAAEAAKLVAVLAAKEDECEEEEKVSEGADRAYTGGWTVADR